MARVKWKSICSMSLCVSYWNSMARSISPIQKLTDAIAGKTGCCSRTAISFCGFLQRISARISMAFWIPYCSLWQGANDRDPKLYVQQDNESAGIPITTLTLSTNQRADLRAYIRQLLPRHLTFAFRL